MCCMMSHGMNHGGEMEGSAGEGGPREPLLAVLQRRYALGEITRDQLEEMKTVLGLSDGKAVGAAAGRGNAWETEHHG